jgi:hypothetical protein
MMMKKLSKKGLIFTVNLSSAEGDGSFLCPKCGMQISPDDDTEDNYEILDTKVANNELSELVISCGKCKSTIKLTGFQQD